MLAPPPVNVSPGAGMRNGVVALALKLFTVEISGTSTSSPGAKARAARKISFFPTCVATTSPVPLPSPAGARA